MFKNLKIGKKLLTLVLSMLTFLLLVSIVAISQMATISKNGTEMAETWLPGVLYAEEVSTGVANFRVQELRHIIAQNGPEMDEVEQNLQDYRKQIDENINNYKATAVSQEDSDKINEIQKIWEEYLTVHHEITALSQQQRNAEAMALMKGESFTRYNALNELCLDLVMYNKVGAEQVGQEGIEIYKIGIVIMITCIILAIAITIPVSIAIVRSITNPVKQLEHAVTNLSQGKLDSEINYRANDELGHLAHGMRKTLEKISIIIGDLSDLMQQFASGNFACSTQNDSVYVGEFQPLMVNMRKMRLQLSDTLGQIHQSANQVSAGAEQVSSGAQAASQGATEQASSVQELAATVNDISTKIQKNAENAEISSKQANEVGQGIVQCNEMMKQMVDAMSEISQSSTEIGKIIKTIEDIAFQTNILALNAAVEAARAGTAGKGFAVVADEVRNLASKSAEASKSTARLIETSIQAVQKGTGLADETAKALMETVEFAEKVIATIAEISEASNEQAQSVAQVTQGIDQISSVVQTNSATAEQSAAASEELSSQAELLKTLVSHFRLQEQNTQAMLASEPVVSTPVVETTSTSYQPSTTYKPSETYTKSQNTSFDNDKY